MSLIDQETKSMSDTTPAYMRPEFDVLIEESDGNGKQHPSVLHRTVGSSKMDHLPSPHDVAHFGNMAPEKHHAEMLRFRNMLAAKKAELAGLNAMNDELWDSFKSGKHVQHHDAEIALRAPTSGETDAGESTVGSVSSAALTSTFAAVPGQEQEQRDEGAPNADPRVALLQSIPSFQHLSNMDLGDMLVHCEEERLTKDQTILQQHTPVKSVSVIVSGKVRVMTSRIAKRKKWALEGLLERVREQMAKDAAKEEARAARRAARKEAREATRIQKAFEGGGVDESDEKVEEKEEDESDFEDDGDDDEEKEAEDEDDEIIGVSDVMVDDESRMNAKERWAFLRNETQCVTERTHTMRPGDMFGTHGVVSPATYIADADTVLLHLPLWAYGRIVADADGMAALDVPEELTRKPEVKQLFTHMEQYTALSTQMALNQSEGVRAEDLMIKLMAAFAPELNHSDVMERTMYHVQKHFGAAGVLLFTVNMPEVELSSSKRARGLKRPCVGAFEKCVTSGTVVDIKDARRDRSWDGHVLEEAGVKGYKQVLLVPVRQKYRVLQILVIAMPAVGRDATAMADGERKETPPPQDHHFDAAGKELLLRIAALLANLRSEEERDATDGSFIRVSELSEPFCVSIRAAEFAHPSTSVWCSVKLYHGNVLLSDEVMRSGEVLAEPIPEKFLDDAAEDEASLPVQFRLAVFNCTLHTPSSSFAQLPRATRVIFELYAEEGGAEEGAAEAIGWVGCELFGFDHSLRTGRHDLKLWPGACPDVVSLTALENTEGGGASSRPDQDQLLKVQFMAMPKPVLHRLIPVPKDYRENARLAGEHSGESSSASDDTLAWVTKHLTSAQRKSFMRVVQEPGAALSHDDKYMLWKLRYLLKPFPFLLGPVLRSVDWMTPLEAADALQLIYEWATPHPHEALSLLTAELADPRIRSFAIQCLEEIGDDELRRYLLQLVQTLKFEHFHDSAVARFLLRRAIKNPTVIGHSLFWLLKAEMHQPLVRERFGLMLNLYLRNIPLAEKRSLGNQMLIMARLSVLAGQIQAVKSTASPKEQRKVLLNGLKKLPLPPLFQLPSSPGVLCTGIETSKCRIIDSTNKPLRLVFTTVDRAVDGRPTADLHVMFKKGDDVRQDQLILQLLAVMDSVWKENDMDLCLSPYRCVATGFNEGMLEMVPNSKTIEDIVRNHSKLHADEDKSKTSSTSHPDQSIVEWLRMYNELPAGSKSQQSKSMLIKNTSDSAASNGAAQHAGIRRDPETMDPVEFYLVEVTGLDAARRRFMLSLAGYCVMACVLGLGNRHFGNIMIRRNGEIFHIDFDLLLGKVDGSSSAGTTSGKTPAADAASEDEEGSGSANDNILRKPFHMARAYLAMLGGRNGDLYREFELLACEAFNVLRRKKNATMIMGLLSLMTASDMEELKSEKDLKYVRDQLQVSKTDDEVTVDFRRFLSEGADR